MANRKAKPADKTRCAWAGSELMAAYHDREWGVPLHDDRGLFEFLILEGAQAGLSWETILRRRENYRAAFENFAVERIARYKPARIAELLTDAGLIRNRLKMEAAVKNARAFLLLQAEFGSFDAFLWPFVGGAPQDNRRKSMADVPTGSPQAEALSKELRRRGFNFVGPTICYAFMQAVGMVNDHVLDCFRHDEVR